MPIETRADILARLVVHRTHVWEAVVGVAHDFKNDSWSAYVSSVSHEKE
jgi:hypothetical protein